MRCLVAVLLAASLAAGEEDPLVVTVADGAVIEAHWQVSVFGRTWAEAVFAPLRQRLGSELDGIRDDSGIDIPLAIRSARGLQVRFLGFGPRGRGRWGMQADLGTQAPQVARRWAGSGPRPQPLALPGADEAWTITGSVLARFGGLVAFGSPADALPLSPAKAANDLALVADLSALLDQAAATMSAAERTRAEPLLALLAQRLRRFELRADLAADGMRWQATLDAEVAGLRAVETGLLARLPATTQGVTLIGLDGPGLWRTWAPGLLAALAPLSGDPAIGDGAAVQARADAALQAAGVPDGLRALVEGFDGTLLFAQTPGMPFPGLTLAIPRTAALDGLVELVCQRLGCAPPAVGGSALLPIPRVPLPLQLACDTGHWVLTTDLQLAATWPAGGPGGFGDTPLCRELLAAAPRGACQLGANDTAATLRMLLGPLNMWLGTQHDLSVAEKQAAMGGLLRLAAVLPPGLHWAEVRERRWLAQGRGGDLTWIAVPAIVAAIAIPNLLESRVTANEAAASATLKSGIFPAQVQFQGGCYQDEDQDNVGEYGLLSELAGRRPTGKVPVDALRLLGGPLRNANFSNGYCFACWLPDGKGGAVGEPEGDAARPSIIDGAAVADANAQERFFVVYAWPNEEGKGRVMFALDQSGQVYETPWDGQEPAWNALYGGGAFGAAPVWELHRR